MEVGADPSPESIDRELARAEANKRRTRLIFIGSALFAIVGVVVLQLARTHQRKRVLDKAWHDAAGCLFGGPLKDGAKASLRFRGIQLAIAGDDQKWPERCYEPLATLHHTLIKQDKNSTLAKHVHKLNKELKEGRGAHNQSYVLDQIVAAAAEIGLSAGELPKPDDKPPPAPVEAWDITTIGEASRLTNHMLGPHTVSSDRWPGADLNLLFHEPKSEDAPVLCTFTANGPEARCRSIGGKAAAGRELRLRGTADRRAPPLLFGRDLGQDVVYRSDTGEEVTRGNIQTAWIADSGYVALATGPIDDDIGTFEVLQQRPGEALSRHGLGPETFEATTVTNWAVAYGQLVVQTVREDEDAEDQELPRLRTKPLPAADLSGGFEDAGELDWVNAPLAFCASQSALALKVGTRAGYLAFLEKGRWGTPVRYERLGSLVQCRDSTMLLHDFGPIRACSASGCKEEDLTDASFGEYPHVRSRRAVLGSKLIAVAESEERLGVRYVHGDGPVRLLFDDLVRRGEVQVNSTVSGTRIFSRTGFAVALLFTEEGVVGIYFGTDGQPKAAAVSWP